MDAISAGINLNRRYRDQSITKLSKVMLAVSTYTETGSLANIKQAREAEPYLAMFEDDWATGQILRQYINGKHKYENAKANGKVRVGEKRRWTSPTNSFVNKPSTDDEIERASSDDHDDNSHTGDDNGSDKFDDDWAGFTHNWQDDVSDGE